MNFKCMLGGVCAILACAGCGEGVRESRTIHGAADGSALSFQHGDQGVFVSRDGQLTKLFQPTPEVLATSSPLWSSDSTRIIFTTATPIQARATPTSDPSAWDANPTGRVFQAEQIRYTCWLHDVRSGTEPAKLFDAQCHHTGYIAANLAVRWHPAGTSVLYLDQRTDGLLELRSWDLAAHSSRTVFPHAAAEFIFDWAPNHQHLVCILKQGTSSAEGIWIGRPDAGHWWQATTEISAEPGPAMVSLATAYGELLRGQMGTNNSPLERLRASRPVWTADGQRFAYVQREESNADSHWLLRRATLDTQQSETVARSPYLLSDLAWHPNGQRLGLIEHGPQPSLRFLDIEHLGEFSKPVGRQAVRHFAGWNAAGDRFAYTVPDVGGPADAERENWAFLLLFDPLARDRLVVVEGDGPTSIISGMRITFPSWAENRLTCWATWTPTHQTPFSLLFGLGLRPGDPAVAFDFTTRSLTWMPVNPAEKIQIGHYYLASGQFDEALEWYNQARHELPPPTPPTLDLFPDSLRLNSSLALYEAICLTRLNRGDEARDRWQDFHANFLPLAPAENEPSPSGFAARQLLVQQLSNPDGLWAALIRELYVVEAFLSLHDVTGARGYLELDDRPTEQTDAKRWSNAIALSQLLLIDRQYADYLDLVADRLLPLAMKLRGNVSAVPSWDWMTSNDPDGILLFATAMAILPACAPEFLQQLESDRISEFVARCAVLRPQDDDPAKLAIDLILQACHDRQADLANKQAAALRIQQNPMLSSCLPADGIAGLIQQLRELTSVPTLSPQGTSSN